MLFKDEHINLAMTKAYCGGDASTGSFSRFGKRRKTEKAEKDSEKHKEEEDGGNE